MSHPIHHSVISRSQKNRPLRILLFILVTAIIGVSILSSNTIQGFAVVGIMILSYDTYILTVYPSSRFQYLNLSYSSLANVLPKYAFYAFGMTAIMASAYAILTFFYPVSYALHDGLTNVQITLETVLIAAVAPSIVEEIVYRHFLQGRVLSFLSLRKRVVIPTITFVYLHLPAYSLSFSGFLAVSTLIPASMCLAFMYEETESVVPCILLHFVFNLSTLFVFAVLI